MTSDPIADMLTRLRNANQALLPEVEVSHSKMKESVARILKAEGYIQGYEVSEQAPKKLKVQLKYTGRRGVIYGLKRVSKPGLRHYVGAREIPRVLGGMGTAIVSTPSGLMSGRDARKNNLGGELVCYVW